MGRSIRRSTIGLVLALALSAVGPAPAVAKDLRGKLGIGAASSLVGAQGLTLRYWAGRSVGLEVLAGTGWLNRSEGPERTDLRAAVQLIYVLREIGPANLMAGLRGVFAYRKDDQAVDASAVTHMAVELPITVEYHFADAFSVQLAAGLAVSLIPDEGGLFHGSPLLEGAEDDPGLAFGLGSAGLLGSAGFTFYF